MYAWPNWERRKAHSGVPLERVKCHGTGAQGGRHGAGSPGVSLRHAQPLRCNASFAIDAPTQNVCRAPESCIKPPLLGSAPARIRERTWAPQVKGLSSAGNTPRRSRGLALDSVARSPRRDAALGAPCVAYRLSAVYNAVS